MKLRILLAAFAALLRSSTVALADKAPSERMGKKAREPWDMITL